MADGGWRPTRSLVWAYWAVIVRIQRPRTTVLAQLKKSQQNRAPACESWQITAKRLVGPRNLPDQLTGWGVRVYAG
jgi:hypothetical protein